MIRLFFRWDLGGGGGEVHSGHAQSDLVATWRSGYVFPV